MSEASVTFAELLRRAQAHEPTSFYGYCETCRAEQRLVLLAETATQEVYGCQVCGRQKVYTVR
jgi:hypothetical protein